MEKTETVKIILALLTEMNDKGYRKYTDPEIAKAVGCTRQYVSLVRLKNGFPHGWNMSPRRLENRLAGFNPNDLEGMSIRQIADKFQISYSQARYLADNYKVKTERQKSVRPKSSRLPSPETLLELKKEGRLTWVELADQFNVCQMTLHRYLKERQNENKELE